MPDLDDLPAIPTDPAEAGAAADLDAAIASLNESNDPAAVAGDPPEPFGRTPLFDFAAGRFVRSGGSPVYVTGLDAVRQWCEMAIRTHRGAHRVYSAAFGMDDPEGAIGQAADVAEAISDWGARLQEALVGVHERIVAIEDFEAHYDPDFRALVDGAERPVGAAFVIDSFTVVTDDDETTNLGPIAVPVGENDG